MFELFHSLSILHLYIPRNGSDKAHLYGRGKVRNNLVFVVKVTVIQLDLQKREETLSLMETD